MSDIAIRVENLSKRYRIGRQEERPETLVGAALGWLKAPVDNFRQLRQLSRFQENGQEPDDIIWALKDVSFEVKRGDVVGIIGRNGAGKSTLLKILSRITEPTSGRVVLNGRVSSLLEVGTGFHPDLTGRENIYLNGAILGMTKREIDRKFDEIVDFSGVERFIDTPVKRYSSGMQVRLAFAVAAHLEPEILLVDEVLAVGDAAFQKKCLGKMGEVAREGRTVLFVSHNMGAVAHLCRRSMLLRDGALVANGGTREIIANYLLDCTESRTTYGPYEVDEDLLRRHQQMTKRIIVEKIELLTSEGEPVKLIGSSDSLRIRIHYHAFENIVNPAFIVSFSDRSGIELIRLSTMPISGFFIGRLDGTGHIDLLIDELALVGGIFFISLGIARPNVEWICKLENVVKVHIEPRDVYGSGTILDENRGLIVVSHNWSLHTTKALH